MTDLRQDASAVGLTYQGCPRTWGMRLSVLDSIVLVGSVAITAALWRVTAGYSFIGLLVVLHFFLFCNIFRIPRMPELIWGGCFLTICCSCLIADVYSPLAVSLITLPFTIAILVWSVRLPSYHGVLANRINPHLDAYLAGQ